MVTSRKLLVLAGLLLAVQLASAGRPLFGLHRAGGEKKVDGAEVKRLRRYVSTLPNEELRQMLVADPTANANQFDRHYMELGHYEVTPDDRAKMQSEVKQYWQHFRANQVEEEYDLDDYLDEDFEPKFEDEDEWFERYSDWYEEDEDYLEDGNEEDDWAEEEDEEPSRPQNTLDLGEDEDYAEEDYADQQPARPQNTLNLNKDEDREDYYDDGDDAKEDEEEDNEDDVDKDDEEGPGDDWVLSLASAMRTGDSRALEASVSAAISAGDKEALRELVGEAEEMAHGDLLQAAWTKMTGEGTYTNVANDEQRYTSAYKLEDEADELEEEAQDIIGEAEDLKMEADALEREAENIDASANEYERMEATDELGEAAEALDTEATKLELESAKLRAEVSRLEAESKRLKDASVSGTDTEAEWLDDEAGRLATEADKLQQEAEELKGKADALDGEADRIDRIEDDRYAADAAARQSRIDEDLDNDGVAYDYSDDNADEPPTSRGKGPLSHSSLVTRFKTLLKVRN